jgi:hypothetical protein
MKILLDYKTWAYVSHWWKGKDEWPFESTENIMYTAHVLQVAASYEALTGDTRYSKKNGISAVDDEGNVHYTDTLQLAQHIAALIQSSPSGGVPCEPGCVFAPCQSHHFMAFRILESIGAVKVGHFSNELVTWEKYLFENMRASIPTGALKVHNCMSGVSHSLILSLRVRYSTRIESEPLSPSDILETMDGPSLISLHLLPLPQLSRSYGIVKCQLS